MTPADLKIRREALGLSGEQLAARCGIQSRSVRRWEAGFTPVPDFVEDVLLEIEVFTDRLVEQHVAGALALIGERSKDAFEFGFDIPTYATDEDMWAAHPDWEPMPASWFRMVCWRVSEELPADVTFHFAP